MNATLKQREGVRKNVHFIGPAKCDVCGEERQDVAEFKAGVFTWARICDTCCALIVRGYDRFKKGGVAI